jgi:hypothetical protein
MEHLILCKDIFSIMAMQTYDTMIRGTFEEGTVRQINK